MSPIPAGTATGNTDALRQSQIAQAFFLFADVLTGVDRDHRMEPGMSGGGIIGPSQSFGVDVGIANDGTVYARGRSSYGQDSMATPAHDAEDSGTVQPKPFTLGPIGWAVLAFIAYKLVK